MKIRQSSKFKMQNYRAKFKIPARDARRILRKQNRPVCAGGLQNFKFLIFNFEFARKRAGFTIIELLVVLAIIGVLVSIMGVAFQTSRAKSRDATREEHIKTLQNALALHTTNIGRYPSTTAGGVCLTGDDSVSTELKNSQSIQAIPRDPRHDCATVLHYQYTALAPGDTYVITYYLETDTIPGKACASPPCLEQATP